MDARAEIYALCCPDIGEVRYIGKANDSVKRLKGHLRDARRRRTPVYDWINSLHKRGAVPILRVLMVTEDWRTHEKALITQYRKDGARLLNVADGGDEPYCSPEQRAKNGRQTAAKLHSDPKTRRIWEIKKALGDMLRDKHCSEETKERCRMKMRQAAAKAPHIFGAWANI